MYQIAEKIVKNRKLIIIICLILLVPAVLGFVMTGINYDILSYLPKDLESVEGQDIMLEQFGKGGFGIEVVRGMDDSHFNSLKKEIEEVDGVDSVLAYTGTVPKEILPQSVLERIYNADKDEKLMMIFFTGTTGEEKTLEAVEEIRKISGNECFMNGVSSVIEDIKLIVKSEMIPYVIIAAILSSLILTITMDSFLIPFLFLSSIGVAILYNLGTNIFMGEISFITLALTAVLQLAVTMDYSIFLYNSFKEEKKKNPDLETAMAHAINNTFLSVVGSSTTTVAGFLALCFMSYTLGANIGIVMAKGVVIGIILCVTLLPSLILQFEKRIEKTMHKDIMPNFDRLSEFIIRHYKKLAVLFVILIFPAFYGYSNAGVYYNLTESLPDDTESLIAANALYDDFDMGALDMVLYSSKLEKNRASEMIDEIKALDGVDLVLGIDSFSSVPEQMIPEDIRKSLESKDYKMLMFTSNPKVASDEINDQIDYVTKITKKYDKSSMVVGEAASTKDLIEVTDRDFRVVNYISIAVVFIIIALVFRSISIPIILVSVIEFAISINMGIPYYTGTIIPFISSIVIGTIQLGSTVDYAILMTTRYKRERMNGMNRDDAVTTSLKNSVNSVLVSAVSFFVATIGVALYTKVDLIGSICTLLSRGAIISMLTVIFMLPAALLIFDPIIIKTSYKFEIKDKGVSTDEM